MIKFLSTFVLLISCILGSLFAVENTKIVCLLSGPRSLSTVFLRMMDSRGDFTIFHEPLTPMYALQDLPDIPKDWYLDSAYTLFSQFEKEVFAAASTKNVFIKDMSFAFYKQLAHAKTFIQHPNVYFILLVRDPHHSVISFSRKIGGSMANMEEAIGLKDLFGVYSALKNMGAKQVKILFSEQLYGDPEAINQELCSYLSIPFSKKWLEWKALHKTFDANTNWKDPKRADVVYLWHDRAIESTSIQKPSSYEVDVDGKPTFSEVASATDREACKAAYRANLPFYQQFLASKSDHLVADSI